MIQCEEAHQQLRPRAYRGRLMHSLGPETLAWMPDGGLLVDAAGRVEACDHWEALIAGDRLGSYEMVTLSPTQWLIPGLIDLHVHLPQVAVAGRQAPDLLHWLTRHIFPEEAKFAAVSYARPLSDWFFRALLQNGTTTAAVFLTSHPDAAQIAFEAAERQGNRVIMGLNLMDCNAPESLLLSADQALSDTEALCRAWHGRDAGRLQYAWMPRFALTSSESLLSGIGTLRARYPDVYLHTHLSEQTGEIAAVLAQFPWATDYTAVYERFGLLRANSLFAHGVHLSASELDRLQAADCALAHCPGSNFFLKSGRFRWFEALRRAMRFGLGSDVGAGPELSLFKGMKDAQYMQNESLATLASLFYAATLGGARALSQEARLGNFLPGKEADFLVLDSQAHPAWSAGRAENGEVLLSRLIYQGDDRLVRAAYVRGQQRYHADGPITPDLDAVFPIASS